MVNRKESLNGFDLDNQAALYKEIEAEARLQPHALEDNWEGHLVFELETALDDGVNQADFIDALQQSGPQLRVHVKGGIDHPVATDST